MNVKKKIVVVITAAIFFALFAAIVLSNNGYLALQKLEMEKQALVKKNKKINSENLTLYRTIKRLKHDPKYIENVARQELGMIGKKEVIIKFKNKRSKE